MRTITIAGAHGQIARQLAARLTGRGDTVRGLIRNPDHAAELRAAGIEPVVCDLEHASGAEVADAVGEADVVVFAAGAGPDSGAARKLSMDRDGAIRLLEGSESARYVMVSALGAEAPPADDEVFSVYLRAKAEADAAVMGSGREWAILRPGHLTDDPASGRITLVGEPRRGAVPRADVADVLVGLVDGAGSGRVLYLIGGETPTADALASL